MRRTIPACAGPTSFSRFTPPSRTDHPRVRGTDTQSSWAASSVTGPSPRARDRLDTPPSIRLQSGTIPACAGPTGNDIARGVANQDHPRVRGTDAVAACMSSVRGGPSPRARDRRHLNCAKLHQIGPSPRARDRQDRHLGHVAPYRTIPACAGPTTTSSPRAMRRRDHPRVRGTDVLDHGRGTVLTGPSPRARDRRGRRPGHRHRAGTIPACAGPTMSIRRFRPRSTDHPRVRGTDWSWAHSMQCAFGPSPRARDRLRPGRSRVYSPRTIPACAGPTTCIGVIHGDRGDHPRVRGTDSGRRTRPA